MARTIERAMPLVALAGLLAACRTGGVAPAADGARTREGQDPGGATVEADKDPYVGELGLQMIRTPAASANALRRAGEGDVPEPPAGASFAIDQSRSWTRRILRPETAPPPEAPFLAFPAEEGGFDLVRAAWRAGDLELETAQSLHVICIRVRGFAAAPGAPPAERAAEAARALTMAPPTVRFEETGEIDGIRHGERVFGPEDRFDPFWPSWQQELRWWSSGDDLGFITLRATGIATKDAPSPLAGFNRRWFEE